MYCASSVDSINVIVKDLIAPVDVRNSDIKLTGCSSHLLGIKNARVAPHKVFSLKRCTVVTFTVSLMV